MARGYGQGCCLAAMPSVLKFLACYLMVCHPRCRDQTEILFFLSAYQFDALGEYDKSFDSLYGLSTQEMLAEHPQGEGLLKAISNFQAALAKAEEDILADNGANRSVPYGVNCLLCIA